MHQPPALGADRPVFHDVSPALRSELLSAHDTQITLLACPDFSIFIQGLRIAERTPDGVAAVIVKGYHITVIRGAVLHLYDGQVTFRLRKLSASGAGERREYAHITKLGYIEMAEFKMPGNTHVGVDIINVSYQCRCGIAYNAFKTA